MFFVRNHKFSRHRMLRLQHVAKDRSFDCELTPLHSDLILLNIDMIVFNSFLHIYNLKFSVEESQATTLLTNMHNFHFSSYFHRILHFYQWNVILDAPNEHILFRKQILTRQCII